MMTSMILPLSAIRDLRSWFLILTLGNLAGDFRSWESPQTLLALSIGPFEHVERFQN